MITDQAYKLPDVVWNIPEAMRAEKAYFDSDLCHFGDRLFIRGLLLVPFLNQLEAFGWGVWVEVDQFIFERYLELYEVDGSSEPPHRGVLANDVLGYPSSLGSEVEIDFGKASEKPMVRLIAQDGSRFTDEQQRGMSDARYHEILDLIEARNSTRQ